MQDNIYFGLDLLPSASLEHFGIPRRSGRYPWGSGENPYHHGASAPGGKRSSAQREQVELKKKHKAAVKEARRAARNSGALTDEELDRKINRLSKEKRLRELTNSEYNQMQNRVYNVLDRVVVGTGVSLAALTLSSVGKVYIRRKMGETTTDSSGNTTPIPWTSIAEYMKPKKK